LQLAELLAAVRSPVAAMEHQHHARVTAERIVEPPHGVIGIAAATWRTRHRSSRSTDCESG
jgi:hypothetical protein